MERMKKKNKKQINGDYEFFTLHYIIIGNKNLFNCRIKLGTEIFQKIAIRPASISRFVHFFLFNNFLVLIYCKKNKSKKEIKTGKQIIFGCGRILHIQQVLLKTANYLTLPNFIINNKR